MPFPRFWTSKFNLLLGQLFCRSKIIFSLNFTKKFVIISQKYYIFNTPTDIGTKIWGFIEQFWNFEVKLNCFAFWSKNDHCAGGGQWGICTLQAKTAIRQIEWGKDYNLTYENLERRKQGRRKQGHQKLSLERVFISKMVISNLISKKLTSIEDTQYRS